MMDMDKLDTIVDVYYISMGIVYIEMEDIG